MCPPPLPARGPGIPRGNPAPTYLNDPAGVLLRGNLTLTWASTSPGTDSLHIIGSIVRDCNPRCQVVTRLVDLNGTSPLQVALPAGGQTMLPSDLVAFTVMPAWSQGGRVRFSIGQDFDLEGVLDFVA